MVCAHILALVLSASTGGETVLLDFSADWCGPCRAVAPTVDQLTAAGYPVRRVNVDRDTGLAQKFHVQSVPCFVLLVDGREVDRQLGPVDIEKFKEMFYRANVAPRKNSLTNRAQSPDKVVGKPPVAATAPGIPLPAVRGEPLLTGPRRLGDNSSSVSGAVMAAAAPSREDSTAESVAPAKFVSASVRLKIEDTKGNSYGSGTIIDAASGEALILTCGHIFRESEGKGKITVDLFGDRPSEKIAGRLVDYDLKSDLGLVAIRADVPLAATHVAPASYQVRRGDRVVSVGCDHGAAPTARESRVTGIDKFLGPPNVQVAGQPVQGRSGGGLFSREGYVIGVCNAADPTDNEGLFAALGSIQALLDRAGLTFVYRDGESKSQIASAATSAPAEMPTRMPQPVVSVPLVETTLPVGKGSAPAAAATPSSGVLSAEEQATLSTLREKTRDAEVICIVRPRGNPDAKSEVIVLDRASPALVDQLSSGRPSQDSRQPVPDSRPIPAQNAPRTAVDITQAALRTAQQAAAPRDADGWRRAEGR